ncbi:MAG: bifunctional glutamate N-acetyltransferase/amino-acid acetyltransferase ArgJ [Shimia sp.]
MELPRSPLAPAAFPDLPRVAGARFATAAAGIKYRGRDDVMLALCDPGTEVAGVFTRSSTRAAPVLDCQAKIAGPAAGPVAIVVNAGNANAFTGHHGQTTVDAVVAMAARTTGADPARVFTASTGVIGEPLPADRITDVLEELAGALSDGALPAAAGAIRTTDTFPKAATRSVEIGGTAVTIAGIAKGSGMVAPDMATMLAYVFTDAVLPHGAGQPLLARLADRTFNCITVDGDTSTSDTLMLAATGASGVDVAGDAAFEAALEDVLRDLAQQVVRDGEGATKFIEIAVTGATSDADARTIGLSIANSPLVKTAIAGEDANWGRVVMAIGKSGAPADRDRIAIRFGDVLVAEKGWVAPGYREADGAAEVARQEVRIGVDLGLGDGAATVWTCDLTHGYISINADYRS